jgi:hypothetical protein
MRIAFCVLRIDSCHFSKIKISKPRKNAFKVYFSAITACCQKILDEAKLKDATIAGIQEDRPLTPVNLKLMR